MTTRIHANNFTTTLNGAINNSTTSVIITSATGFPSVGAGVTANITVQEGSTFEIMTVTARTGTTLTVTRAAEGTSASAFSDLSEVEIRVTADSLDRKLDTANLVESAIGFTDITTNDASTSNHGFLKKLDNNAAHYMDGTGAWSTPAGGGGGGGLVKLAVATASSSATLDFTSVITSTYDNYMFIISDLKGSIYNLSMLVSFDNGSTWKNSAGYNQAMMYIKSNSSTVSGNVASNDSQFNINATQNRNSTTVPLGGTITMTGANGAVPLFDWKIAETGSGGGYHMYVTGGGQFYDGTSPPINAIRFIYGIGTFASGTITLYGYEK